MDQRMDKLVRDKIPQVIRSQGRIPVTRRLTDEEYARELDKKLLEEVQEYLHSGTLEELADIGEVLHAILALKDISVSELQAAREQKHAERGGFADRVYLEKIIN